MGKILVVDDEEMMRMIARRVLSKEYEVVLAGSGAEALEIYEKEKPDMILSDLLMPEMNGFEMYRILQEKPGVTAPIMYMTADDAEEVEDQGLNLGAADFIRKPFRPEVLLKRVSNIMGNVERISSLAEEAFNDRLTGLLNKAGTLEVVGKAVQEAKGALVMVDLDSFKLVNDLYGHDMGDRVLKEFADILISNTASGDIRCRIGGDEFLLFARDVSEEGILRDMSERVNRQVVEMAQRLMGEDVQIPLGASFGVVFAPAQGRSYEELTQKADNALYTVKKNGKHGISFYREMLNRKNVQADEADASIEEIHRISQVLTERNMTNAALWLEKDSFGVVYRFMLRYIRTYHGVAYRVLVTLQKKDETLDDATFAQLAEDFGNMINHALRKSDIMMQNRFNQYFLVLPELSDEFVESVFARIRNAWRETDKFERTVIRFDAEKISSDDEPGREEKRHGRTN